MTNPKSKKTSKDFWQNPFKRLKTSPGLFHTHSYHNILSLLPKPQIIFFVCFIRERCHRKEIRQIMQLEKAVKMHTPKHIFKTDTK